MCPECGGEYGCPDWCPEEKARKARATTRASAETVAREARALARLEVISELIGWLKARIELTDGNVSGYRFTLEHLEALKKH